jgi:DASH complex subunit DAM1
MADLEANFMHLQLMHESLARFGESFAGFLYGLNMNAFVVDFPEAPDKDGIKRWERAQRRRVREEMGLQGEGETTVTIGATRAGDETTLGASGDTSYASMKATPRRKSMMPPVTPGAASTAASGGKSGIPSVRGGAAGRGMRGAARGGRASGLPRGRGRGAR